MRALWFTNGLAFTTMERDWLSEPGFIRLSVAFMIDFREVKNSSQKRCPDERLYWQHPEKQKSKDWEENSGRRLMHSDRLCPDMKDSHWHYQTPASGGRSQHGRTHSSTLHQLPCPATSSLWCTHITVWLLLAACAVRLSSRPERGFGLSFWLAFSSYRLV